MTQKFTDDWLQHKPKFRIHQRVMATPRVVGRISGMQQVDSEQWRYQVSTPAQYGVTLSWWDENQLKAYFDLYTVILVEEGKEVEGCMAGTLDEALEDVQGYVEKGFKSYQEEGRKLEVRVIFCPENLVDSDPETSEHNIDESLAYSNYSLARE